MSTRRRRQPPRSRGYTCIALHNPKNGENVGGTLRAIGVYGASMLVLGGVRPSRFMGHPTDTMKMYRHVPTVMIDDVFDAIPFDCVPIAVDLIENAVPLPNFTHPERAFYIFGAEDATLGRRITDRCQHAIYIPTPTGLCSNLASAVNIVLYDRMWKRQTTDRAFPAPVPNVPITARR